MNANEQTPTRRAWLAPVVTILLVLCSAALLGVAQSWKRDLRIRSVAVVGTNVLQSSEVVAAAGVVTGGKLFALDLAAVKHRVEQNPYVRQASVQRDAPGKVTITVEEREPLAAVLGAKMVYIDSEGYVLPAGRSGQLFDLPLISYAGRPDDLVPGTRVMADGVQQALAVLKAAKMIGDETYRRISEVRVDGNHDLLFYTAEYGVPVVIGHGDEAAKLLALDGFWKDVVAVRGARGLQYVDLRFEDQVVVRWNQDRTAGVQ